MTLEGLLAIAGIIVALYAVAQPVQRRSVGLFVPVWLVPGSLVLSAVILLWREGGRAFGHEFSPRGDFAMTVASFALPIVATSSAIWLWHAARITKRKDTRFRGFVLTCLRENRFDELVRIIEKNWGRFALACTADTLDVLFEPRFTQAMIQARTWLHLQLLADNAMLDSLPDHIRIAWQLLRELLLADNSPLRNSAIVDEGGDETLCCTDEENRLVDSTLRNPRWYHHCRAGHPLLIAACERIDSGSLEAAYNRVDAQYGARQGVATRTKRPIFLTEKTISHALSISLETNNASAEDTHADATDLYSLFMAIYARSTYSRETWDEPFEHGDYPTAFGYLLAEILSDFERMCHEAWRKASYGAKPPAEIVVPVARMWAYCVMYFTEDSGKVSAKLRIGNAISYLDWTLERQYAHVKASQKSESEGAWARIFMDGLKEAALLRGTEGNDFLTEAADRLDFCKVHVLECDPWLRSELELPPRQRPRR